MRKRPSNAFPSSGAARHLLPNGEKNGPAFALLSSPHRGEVARRSRVGEGVFKAVSTLVATTLFIPTASAVSLVLPHHAYGNAEGCAFIATGHIEGDTLRYLMRQELSSFGSLCSFVSVHADTTGNQRADAICHYEGETMLGAEDFVIAATSADAPVKIYTAAGEVWGELEPCS